MITLKVIKNRNNGQVFVNIPKSVAELHRIDDTVKIILEHKHKDEFSFKIKRG